MSLPVGRTGAGPRLLRAAVFTAVCVVLSATGHALASCAPVPWWTLTLGFLGTFTAALTLAGRERSLPAITAALACGQFALHTLFGLGQHRAALEASASSDASLLALATKLICGPGNGRMTVADAHRIVTDAGLDPTAQHHHPAPLPAEPTTALLTLPMALGHLLAALAAGWLLRRGELALLRLARLSAHGAGELAAAALVRSLRAALALVRALRAGLPGAPSHGPRAPRTAGAALLPCAAEPLQHTVIRRGPPADEYSLAA
ncbi:hypothetical protein GCM10020367_31850 [Streptomyces sannanensis]|uniref:Integral membrane protein n=1 Tax=Streptomyces sannanensis TaxID=285536 RepID=A0ABP6SC45_9ACTN